MKPEILFEDKDIIVCVKKAGEPVQSDKTLDYDLVNRLKNYLCEEQGAKNPYIGLVHRLDRPVGGVMVFAKNKKAAAELSKQVQEKSIGKWYSCVVLKELPELLGKDAVVLEDYIKKNGKTNTSEIVKETDKEGKVAKLAYKVMEVVDGKSLIEVELFTGRHHQIRLQMAAHVAGLAGDTKYNKEAKKEDGRKGVALFSNRLVFTHPTTGKTMEFEAKPTGIWWNYFSSVT